MNMKRAGWQWDNGKNAAESLLPIDLRISIEVFFIIVILRRGQWLSHSCVNRNPLRLHGPKDNAWEELTVCVAGARAQIYRLLPSHNKDDHTGLKRAFFYLQG